MATILPFQCEKAAVPSEDDQPRDEQFSAEIIIFPGVRIERYEDDSFDACDEAEVKTARQD